MRCTSKARNIINDEHGGAHILVFVLLASTMLVLINIIALNWMMQSSVHGKTKTALDQATRAAAMDVDEIEKARGRIVWDTLNGTSNFYKYLRLNMNLDTSNNPLTGSYLTTAPVVHVFEEVSAPSYPHSINRSITLYPGTQDETTRNVAVTIYGPSILAIVEVRQPMIGLNRSEPLVLSSVSSIRFW